MSYPELRRQSISRRTFLVNALGFGLTAADVALGMSTYAAGDRQLTLRYGESPRKVEQAIPFEMKFGSKLIARFLPVEHAKDQGLLMARLDTVRTEINSPQIEEVWVEAYPPEYRHFLNSLPTIIGLQDKVKQYVSQRLVGGVMDAYDFFLDMVCKRPQYNVDPVDIVCPDLVGGSLLMPIIRQQYDGVHFYIAALLSLYGGFGLTNKIKSALELNRFARNKSPDIDWAKLTRREMIAVTAAIGTSVVLLETKSNIKHGEQIIHNAPVQNYVTEDTFREAWLLYALIAYGQLLDQKSQAGPTKILFMHTPPHIEAMMKRLTNWPEYQREMKMYFDCVPREIWTKGVRRYHPDLEDGIYKPVPFSLYPTKFG